MWGVSWETFWSLSPIEEEALFEAAEELQHERERAAKKSRR